ncbi:MAG: hypothetical protein ACLPY1_18380 [Terracidiphilus sp.]
MLILNKESSPLQKWTLRAFTINFVLLVGLSTFVRLVFEHSHPGKAIVYLLSFLPAFPVVGMVWVIGRYLSRETDEFVRMLSTNALLWALGVTMVVDTVLGALNQYNFLPGLLPVLNIELFWITALIVLHIQLWRNR